MPNLCQFMAILYQGGSNWVGTWYKSWQSQEEEARTHIPAAPGAGGLSISWLGFSRYFKISQEINEEAKFSSSSWRRPGRAVPGPAELADVV